MADLPPPSDHKGGWDPGARGRGRWGETLWWVWVLVVIAIPTIVVFAGQNESSDDNNEATRARAPTAPPAAAQSLATKRSLTNCLTEAGVSVDTSGPSARLRSIDSAYIGTVTFTRGGSADLWVTSAAKQLHPIRRAREIAESAGGAYYWDVDANVVFAIPADARLSRGDQVGKTFDACLNG